MNQEDRLYSTKVEQLFDKGDLVLFRWNNDEVWSIDHVSKNVSKLLGYSHEEFLNGTITYAECIHPDFLENVQIEVAQAKKENLEFFQHKPYKVITKDGDEKWVLDQTSIERDENNNILYFLGYLNDITHTMKLSEENRRLNERFELAITGSSNGVWDWDIASGNTYFSPTWKSMLGYTEDEIQNTAEAFFDLIHPEDKQKVKDTLDKHFQGLKQSYAVEIRLRKKDGSYKWVLSKGKALFDAQQKPIRMLGLHVDISEQKKIEQQLQESELRWKFAIEGSGDGLWDWNLEDDSVYFSLKWKQMLGFEEDEIANTLDEWSNRVRPEHLAKVYSDLQNYLDGVTSRYVNEHQVVCKDGSYKWVLDRGVIVERKEDGTPLRMIGTHTDIDAKKKTQQRLDQLNQRFNTMFENHKAIMLLVKHENGEIIDANKSAQEFYGYTHEEFQKLNINQLNTASPQEVQKLVDKATKGKSNSFVFEHKKKSGETVTIETNTSLIETDAGNFLFSIISDITQEKKQKQQLTKLFNQLKSAQKIAKLGLWELNHETGTLEWSDEIYTIFGIDQKEFQPSYVGFIASIHPDDRESVIQAFEKSLKTKEPYEISHRVLLQSGEIKYVLEQCSTEFDVDGNPIISKGTVQDITELERLDVQMRQERERLKTIMDNSSDAILIVNKQHELIDCNRMTQKLLGYSREELLQLKIEDWDIQLNGEALQGLMDTLSDKPTIFETQHKRKDGSIYDASINAVLIELDEEQFIYASVRDISELKKLQNEILYEKNFINTIIESANAIIAVIDANGTMIKLNSYGQKFTGYTQKEIAEYAYKWKVLLPQEIQAKVVGIVENARRGNIIKSFQNTWISKSGEMRMFEWSNTLVKKDDGSMDYIATIGIDITQQQEHRAFVEMLINSQSHMVILAGDEQLKYVNGAVLEFFGFDSFESLKNHMKCMCEHFVDDGHSFYPTQEQCGPAWIKAISKLPTEKQIVAMYSKIHHQIKNFQVSIEHYDETSLKIVSFVDVTESIKKQHALEYKSYHDPLTQVYNRSYIYENWDTIIHSHKENGLLSVVAVIDIDYFKNVNDTYGHDIGDAVLRSLVSKLQTNSRTSDILIRWGGEEFLLIAPVRKKEYAHKLLEKLRLAAAKEDPTLQIAITISIGAAIYEENEGSTLEKIVNIADENLYISKSSGRNRVTLL